MTGRQTDLNRRGMLAGGLAATAALAVRQAAAQDRVIDVDIAILGATAGGVVAAVQTHLLGRRALLIEPGRHLGGLSSGGLGQTDAGNRGAIGGLSRRFYERVEAHYKTTYGEGSAPHQASHNGFRFEPHVAEMIFRQMVDETGVKVLFEEDLQSVVKVGRRLTELVTDKGTRIRAKIFLDCTYEGDLLAAAGVSYHVGRESNQTYGETLNGIQFRDSHNFRVPIDPYVVPGDPASGLLKGISPERPGNQGDGDRSVQAYNFRMCLTRAADRLPFPQPPGYDPERYTLLARYIDAGIFDALNLSTPMPCGKTDTNNHGGFSTDNIGMNHAYPEADKWRRELIVGEHVTYQQGLMWFLCNDERVPETIRERVRAWGLPRDEFTDNGGWPHQLYVREARRMISDHVMTEHTCRGREIIEDPVGLASYTMDSHNCRRLVINGFVRNEGDVQVGVPRPYSISYRSIRPRESECENLLVPVCLSSSHIAYGSIRMEPVFMILGQSAATAADMALGANVPVQGVDTNDLARRLLADDQRLVWLQTAAPPRPVQVAFIDPAQMPGVTLDDADGVRTGTWVQSDRGMDRKIGRGYIHDGNTAKGETTISFTPDLPTAGKYTVFLYGPANANRASNVPLTVKIGDTVAWQGTIDQRQMVEGKMELVTLELPAGKQTTLTVGNAGTEGFVVVDGVQFLPTAGDE